MAKEWQAFNLSLVPNIRIWSHISDILNLYLGIFEQQLFKAFVSLLERIILWCAKHKGINWAPYFEGTIQKSESSFGHFVWQAIHV